MIHVISQKGTPKGPNNSLWYMSFLKKEPQKRPIIHCDTCHFSKRYPKAPNNSLWYMSFLKKVPRKRPIIPYDTCHFSKKYPERAQYNILHIHPSIYYYSWQNIRFKVYKKWSRLFVNADDVQTLKQYYHITIQQTVTVHVTVPI